MLIYYCLHIYIELYLILYIFPFIIIIWLICLKFKTGTDYGDTFTYQLLQSIIKIDITFVSQILNLLHHTHDLHLYIPAILFMHKFLSNDLLFDQVKAIISNKCQDLLKQILYSYCKYDKLLNSENLLQILPLVLELKDLNFIDTNITSFNLCNTISPDIQSIIVQLFKKWNNTLIINFDKCECECKTINIGYTNRKMI